MIRAWIAQARHWLAKRREQAAHANRDRARADNWARRRAAPPVTHLSYTRRNGEPATGTITGRTGFCLIVARPDPDERANTMEVVSEGQAANAEQFRTAWDQRADEGPTKFRDEHGRRFWLPRW